MKKGKFSAWDIVAIIIGNLFFAIIGLYIVFGIFCGMSIACY